MNRLRLLFIALKSKISDWWFEKQLDLKEEVVYSTKCDDFTISEVEHQSKLAEGLLLLKQNVTKQADTDLDSFLRNDPNLIRFAEVEDEVKDLIRKTWNTMPVDIVTDADKARMIDKRIAHYYELQKFNEEKALIKRIRKAKKDSDLDLYNKLFDEWKERYGNYSKTH
jgi:hypothetical protein